MGIPGRRDADQQHRRPVHDVGGSPKSVTWLIHADFRQPQLVAMRIGQYAGTRLTRVRNLRRAVLLVNVSACCRLTRSLTRHTTSEGQDIISLTNM